MPRTQSPAPDIRTLPTLPKDASLIQAGVEAQHMDVVVRVILNERHETKSGVVDADLVRVEAFAERMADAHQIGSVGRSGCAFWCTLRELQTMGAAMIEAAESARQLMPAK